MAPRPKTGGTPVKLERPQKFQAMVYSNILQSQQTDANRDLADAVLICDGVFLLQAASPLIQKAVSSQGENYPYIREILLPDFPVKSIERMLNLVYKGYADLQTDDDVESLKEVLKFFEISSVDFNLNEDENCKTVQGALKVQELNRIPQDIFKMGGSTPKASSVKGKGKKKVVAKEEDGQGSSQQAVRRSGRPPKPVMKLKDQDANGEKSDDPDFSGNSSSSDDERSDDESKPKRGRRPGSKQPVVKTSNSPSKNVATPSGSKSTSVDKKGASNISGKTSSAVVPARESKKEDDSSTDSEDEGWVKPNFKDKEWFARESTRCQCCEKKFDVPAGAALCITSHKTLRCYFCFKVYSTTDILFRHFKKRHKQAGRENTLICPFCDNAVPYKSVSCHVISTHFSRKTSPEKPYANVTSSTPSKPKPGSSTDKDAGKNGRAGPSSSTKAGSSGRKRHSPSPSRSPSTDRASGNDRKRKKQEQNHPPAKKGSQLKIGNLKSFKQKLLENNKKKQQDKEKLEVRNLDVTIEKTTASGRTLVFRVQKKRPVLTNGNS